MSVRIVYNQSLQTGKMLAQAVHQLIEARNSALRVKVLLDKCQWGSPADWAAVVVELGLIDKIAANGQPAYTALQQAQDAWTLLSNAVTAIDVAAINSELARLDQG